MFSVTNVKTFPGADCGSDHQLLIADFRLRFNNKQKPVSSQKVLTKPELETFKGRITQALTNIDYKDNVEELWTNIRETILRTASQCHRPGIKDGRKPWISDKTWEVIEKRKQLKTGTFDETVYRSMSKNILRRCRKDKENYISNICREIEAHGHRNETKDLFKKVKLLAREFKPRNYAVEDEHGIVVSDMETTGSLTEILYSTFQRTIANNRRRLQNS